MCLEVYVYVFRKCQKKTPNGPQGRAQTNPVSGGRHLTTLY